MLKTLALTVAFGVAAVSAAMPHSFVSTTDSLHEPGSLLVLATALFAVASVMRRHGGGTRRR